MTLLDDERRVVTLKQASELTTLSPDTIRRRYGEKLIKLSPRRVGLRLGDVLKIQVTK